MKKWYTSKTLWVAILTGIVGVLQVTQQLNIPAEYNGAVLFAIGLVNFFLRTITAQPVSIGSELDNL